jgi:dTDP-6-deoxy-L-talose 4-dehydrogenase (NAD+)
MKPILVTGGSGFIGQQVVRSLQQQPQPLRLLVRPGKNSTLSVREGIDEVIESEDLFAEPLDRMCQLTSGIDTIVHVAWYAEHGKYLQSEKNLDCLIGTLQLAKAASLQKVRRFVGVGSCFEFRFGPQPLAPDSPLAPETPYASAKVAAYYGLLHWLALHQISFAWCRLFYLFGEGENPKRLVPYLHQQLAQGHPVDLTSGNQVRDFIDVREAGRQIAQISLSDRQGPQNICTGKGITVRQLALDVAQQYGRPDLLRFGARPDNLTDPPFVVGIPSIPTADPSTF